MSGGSFDYAYMRVLQFADDLAVRLDEFDKVDQWGDEPNNFEQATRDKLAVIEANARYTAALMREAEWLYSGDTGDDSFMKRVAEIQDGHA